MQEFSLLYLYAFFAAGQALYILRRASAAVRSATNPVKSRKDYVVKYWDIFIGRAVVAAVLFGVFILAPDFIATSTGVNLKLPAHPLIALGGGLATDFILDWAAQKSERFGREIPRLPNGETPPTS